MRNKDSKTVCWGMIGCGDVTEKKSGPALYKCENSKLKIVYSRTYSKALDYAKRHNIEKTCRSIEEMLEDDEIQAVYIATPPSSHKDYAIKCIEHGKIPLIEKPMAQSYAECLEIYEASKMKNIPVYVNFYRRGMEKHRKIKEIIDNNELGKVLCVQIKQFKKAAEEELDREKLPWRLIPSLSGGGKFIDMAPHVLDIVNYLFGDIVEVHGVAENYGHLYDVEDTVTAIIKTNKNILINGIWCYVSDYEEEEICIIGDKGTLRTGVLSYSPIIVKNHHGEEKYSYNEPEHVAMPYIQSIINEIIGLESSQANLDSAINTVRVIDEILKQYRKNYK